MKTIVLFSTFVLAVAMPPVANAAPAGGCDQLVQNINSLAGTIAGRASSYWTHRAKFVELTFGELRQTVINWQELAAQEKSQADPLKTAMPNTLASFKALIAAAQSQNCLPSAQLSAIVEPVHKLAKHVNFDQFPVENFEGSAD